MGSILDNILLFLKCYINLIWCIFHHGTLGNVVWGSAVWFPAIPKTYIWLERHKDRFFSLSQWGERWWASSCDGIQVFCDICGSNILPIVIDDIWGNAGWNGEAYGKNRGPQGWRAGEHVENKKTWMLLAWISIIIPRWLELSLDKWSCWVVGVLLCVCVGMSIAF